MGWVFDANPPATTQNVGPTQPGTSEWPSGLAEVAVAEGDAHEQRA